MIFILDISFQAKIREILLSFTLVQTTAPKEQTPGVLVQLSAKEIAADCARYLPDEDNPRNLRQVL